MKKTIVLFLIIGAFGFASKPANMPFPSQKQAEYDLKKCSTCNLGDHSIDEIIKFYPTEADSEEIFYVNNYCLIFVSIPSGIGGCSFDDSELFVYLKKDNSWIFKGLLPVLYKFNQINKTNVFKSEVACTQMDSEQRFLSRAYIFKEERLLVIKELGGFDRSLYYLNLFNDSRAEIEETAANSTQKSDALKKFNSAIRDTICDYSVFKNFIFNQNKLVSYSIERNLQILKGGKKTNGGENGLDVIAKTLIRTVKF